MTTYRYTECGLENVIIEGLDVVTDDAGEEVYCIENIHGLHRAIASSIVAHSSGISPEELRFLRTEMGMTQAELAQVVHREHQTVGRWERGEKAIDPTSEAFIRKLAIEKLGLEVTLSVED